MKRARLFVFLALILITVFIFQNSLPDQPTSNAISKTVKAFVEPMLELFVGEGNVTNHLVRKLAHFCEFGVLGIFLAVLFRRVTVAPFFIVMTVGLLDETIQMYTGRGDMVKDVWLDFFGGCTGYAVGLCAIWLVRRVGQRRRSG